MKNGLGRVGVFIGFVLYVQASAQAKVVLDTTLGEGQKTRLTATVKSNVTGFWWSVVDGLPYKLLDPESKSLDLQMPRVTKNEFIRFRFTAKVMDSSSSQDIIIRILDDAPDPQFTLPSLRTWDGGAPLGIRPTIGNLTQIKICRFPVLKYTWALDSVPVDTTWKDSTLWLKAASGDGRLAIRLCLDNGGAPTCKSTSLTVLRPSVGVRFSAARGALSSEASFPFGKASRFRPDGKRIQPPR